MKERYEEPVMELILLDDCDVICDVIITSGDIPTDDVCTANS